MFSIQPTPRVRASPYFDGTVADGVCGFTVYNQMLLPTGYGDPEGEYWRLLNGVSMWDVAAQRQVQLYGADALELGQILTTRNIENIEVGKSKYCPMCNHAGSLINDPVLLKLADDLCWFSIADSNILLWAQAVCAERGLAVEVTEPDVSPLAIQGPKAVDVTVQIFGEWTRSMKYFEFHECEIEKIPLVVSRSGYSKQGGFELYLKDSTQGTKLWDIVREAGKPWDISPGTPNHSERIESALLSYGTDTDDETNPFEVRLGKYVDLSLVRNVIGISALQKVWSAGPRRRQLGVMMDGHVEQGLGRNWYDVIYKGMVVGAVTSSSYSWRLRTHIGLSLVDVNMQPGHDVEIRMDSGLVSGQLAELPFF